MTAGGWTVAALVLVALIKLSAPFAIGFAVFAIGLWAANQWWGWWSR